MQGVRQALILVGGKGTRLGGLTSLTPKPLLEVAGTPFLDGLLANLARQGIDDIILLAGHLGHQIFRRYHGCKIGESQVRVLVEDRPLGTAGAVTLAKDYLRTHFLVCNGDSYLDVDLFSAFSDFTKSDAPHGVVLTSADDRAHYGAIEVANFHAVRIGEKKECSSGLINAGIYCFHRSVLDKIDASRFQSIETDLLPELIQARLVGVHICSGYFLDIGRPETFERAQLELEEIFNRDAIFFDRDGLLIHDSGYTHKVEDLSWQPGAQEAISLCVRLGAHAFVVTNQAGVGLGYYSTDDMRLFHAAMNEELRAVDGWITQFYACPFREDSKLSVYRTKNHPCRKPEPGLILRAIRDWNLDPRRCAMFGNKDSDVQAGRTAGLRISSLVAPGELLGKVHASINQIDRELDRCVEADKI